MHYSITFGETGATKNTWDDWKLVPESPPVIPSPSPKTNYVDIPGRIRGPLDLSEIPFGHLNYERITGSWTFIMWDDYWNTPDRKAVWESVRGWLHGKSTRIVLEEDPTHYFIGRFTVDPPVSSMGPFAIKVNFNLEPMRYNLSNDSIDTTWLPDLE